MSRWRPERAVVRLADGLVPDEGDGAPAAMRAVAALARQLDAHPQAAKTRVACIVPSRFVRYLAVPWNAAMQSASARQAFAEHCFRETFGTLARDWVVRVDAPHWERPSLACAMESGLLDALARMMAERKLVLCSVQPALMHEFNALDRASTAGARWIVVPDADGLTLLLVEDGHVVCVKVVAGGLGEVDAILAREWFMLGREAPAPASRICAPPTAAAATA